VSACRSLRGLAEALEGQGRFAEAESTRREVLLLTERSYGKVHYFTANAEVELAECLVKAGKKPESDQEARQALDIARSALGPGHPWIPIVCRKVGPLLEACGRPSDAEGLLREAWNFDRAHLPANHPRLLDSALVYAASFADHHRTLDAQASLRDLDERYQQELPARSWKPAVIKMRLGAILAKEHRFGESEKLLLNANATLVLAFDQSDEWVAESRAQLVRCYESWGKPERAKVFQ
jgi:hypothetical protein